MADYEATNFGLNSLGLIHDVASGDAPVTSAVTTPESPGFLEGVAETVTNLPKFLAASVASGGISIYNTGVAVANAMGAGAQEVDVAAALAAVDDDLGIYYQQHKMAADVGGMILGSFIPGLGAVGALRKGQTAMRLMAAGEGIGATAARVTGILAPDVASYSAAARAAVASGTQRYNVLNTAIRNSIGTQVQQQVLEAAAFETASMLAMGKGEILKDQEIGDIVHDWGVGVVTGGLFGGAIETIRGFRAAGKVRNAVDVAVGKILGRAEAPALEDGTQASMYLSTMSSIKPLPTAEDILMGKVPGVNLLDVPLASAAEASTVQLEAAQTVLRRMEQQRNLFVQESTNKFTGKLVAMTEGKDSDLAQATAGLFLRGSDPNASALLGATKLQRLGGTEISKAALERGERREWIKLFGDEVAAEGQVFDTAPRVWRVADLAKNSEQLDALISKVKLGKTVDFRNLEKVTPLSADARFLKADRMDPFELTPDSKVSRWDVPLIKKAILFDRTLTIDGTVMGPEQLRAELPKIVTEIIEHQKPAETAEAAAEMLDKIAAITDVPRKYFDGARSGDLITDMFANETTSERLRQTLEAQGRLREGTAFNAREQPMFAAIQYAPEPPEMAALVSPEFVVDAKTYIAARAKLAQQVREAALAEVAPADFLDSLPQIKPSEVTRAGAGAHLLGGADSAYLSQGAIAEHVGRKVNQLKYQKVQQVNKEFSNSTAVLQSDARAAAEVGGILFAKIRSAGEGYRWLPLEDAANGEVLVLDSVLKSLDPEDMPKTLADLADAASGIETKVSAFIEPKTAGAYQVLKDHQAQLDVHAQEQYHLAKARGLDGADRWKDRVGQMYAPPVNPKDFPFYAIVQDKTLAGSAAGGTSMIVAQSADQLAALIRKIPVEEGFAVHTKAEAERYWESIGKYDYDKTLHESRVNSMLKRQGIMSSFIPPTDGNRLASDLLAFHTERAANRVRQVVEAKYLDEFATIRAMGEEFSDVASSRFGGTARESVKAKVKADNPYEDFIRTALDLGKFQDHKWLWETDQLVNEVGATLMRSLGTAAKEAKIPKDYEQISALLEEHGVKTAFHDAALYALVNHKAGAAPVTKFVKAANGILATVALRLDSLNALTNGLGATITRSAELRFLLNGIKGKGSTETVGALNDLVTVGAPGSELRMLSAAKLQKEGLAHFISAKEGDAIYDALKADGWVTSGMEMHSKMLDDLTLTATDNALSLNGRLSSAAQKAQKLGELGAKWTGNNYVESLNRYVSAYCAKRIADLAVDAGVIGEAEAKTIISTFVSRVEGTLVASQKPVIFNGAIGSALGLFQSYQFRLAQQLLRFVGEGDKMATAYMMGLQGTLFGANGLPGFQQMNQHIVGTLSMNPEHKDFYDVLYGAGGKAMGDLITYGAPSNLLQTAVYTRGDISPRHPFVLPNTFADVPVVGMFSKAFGAIGQMIQAGAETKDLGYALLTGLEHNGVNRPIAGLASLTRGLGYNNGKIVSVSGTDMPMFNSEVWSFSQVARLAGGKPMQEAIATDALYRIRALNQADAAARKDMAQEIRQHLAAGTLTPEVLNSKVEEFVKTGKTQKQFATWSMGIIRDATEEKRGVFSDILKSPYAYKMQSIIGGSEWSNAGHLITGTGTAPEGE